MLVSGTAAFRNVLTCVGLHGGGTGHLSHLLGALSATEPEEVNLKFHFKNYFKVKFKECLVVSSIHTDCREY